MSETDYKPTQLMVDWEKALRTPGLEQTTGALCKENNDGTRSYCCLGVLEIVAGNTPKRQDDPGGYLGEAARNLEFHGPTAHGETGLPGAELMDQLMGRVTTTGEYPPDNLYLGVDTWGSSIEAAALNDEHGWSFEQIADQIRAVYIDGDGDYTKHEIDLGTGCDDSCDYC
jgi:hypothetical protein